METYSPESRTIQVKAFEDDSYPFKAGTWSKFENVQFPNIKKVSMEKIVQQGESNQINIETEGVTSLLYFILDNEGSIQISEELEILENQAVIKLASGNAEKLKIGTNQIKIFGVSDSVLKPDIYETNFLVTKEISKIPKTDIEMQDTNAEVNYEIALIGIILISIIIGIVIVVKKKN